jgi:hypothetical protein
MSGTQPSIPLNTSDAPKGAQSLQEFLVETYVFLSVILLIIKLFCARKLPNRAHGRRIDFFGKIDHPFISGQRFFSFMVVIAKTETYLMGNGAFFYAAYKNVRLFFLDKMG